MSMYNRAAFIAIFSCQAPIGIREKLIFDVYNGLLRVYFLSRHKYISNSHMRSKE